MVWFWVTLLCEFIDVTVVTYSYVKVLSDWREVCFA